MPYDADIPAALQRLRREVFDRGDYIFGHGMAPEEFKKTMQDLRPGFESMIEELLKIAEDATLPEYVRLASREWADEKRKELDAHTWDSPQAEEKPRTIEELLEKQAEAGTHSILDIECISTRPKFGAISPFPNSKLLAFFGSDTPSHTEIEQAHEFGSLEKYVSKRWQGIYVIAYRDGSPDEIFFAGCSGD